MGTVSVFLSSAVPFLTLVYLSHELDYLSTPQYYVFSMSTFIRSALKVSGSVKQLVKIQIRLCICLKSGFPAAMLSSYGLIPVLSRI